MKKPNRARGRRRLGRPLIAAIVLFCLAGLDAGCANDPYSQHRIALRRALIQQTIQGIAHHEAGATARLQQQSQEFRLWYAQDVAMFQERMRTAGDDIW